MLASFLLVIFMRRFLKNFVLSLVLLGGIAAGFQAALAADYGLTETSKTIGFKQDDSNTVTGMVGRVVTAALGVLAFVFFGLMLYAGFRWMTAQGNEEAVSTAKSTIFAAIIGLGIVSASYAIARFTLDKLGG